MNEQSNYSGTKRRNVRVLVVAVAVVALIVSGFVVYFSSKWGDKPESARVTEHQFANSWVGGSRQAWVLSGVPEPAEFPLAAKDRHMVVATKNASAPDGVTLYGYDINGADPKLLWTQEVVANPDLLRQTAIWGNYAVYAGQLIDVVTGEIVDAPWPDDAQVSVADYMNGDYAVACVPGGECAGYSKVLAPLWSIPFEGSDVSPLADEGGDYFALLYSPGVPDAPAAIVNAATGETIAVDGDLNDVFDVAPMTGGWQTFTPERPRLVLLDGTVENLGPTGPAEGTGDRRLVITRGDGPTVDDVRLAVALDREPGRDQIVGSFDSKTCAFEINGHGVDLTAQVSGDGAGTGDIASGTARGGCNIPVHFFATSSDGNVVAALVYSEEGEVDYVLLDATNGAVLWRYPMGDGVVPARPNLIVTLGDGHVIGWKPIE
ncbi:MAG: hypothetical protein QM705_00235 [Ancrocorticia sp.]